MDDSVNKLDFARFEVRMRKGKTYDRDLLKVRTSITVDLSVNIREKAALEKWIIREIDTANQVARRVLHKIG